MSMYIVFFSTTLLRSSALMRCGGLAPRTPRRPLGRLDHHALAQEDLVEPAAELHELEEALLGHVPDHEADLVHVRGEHDARGGPRAGLLADDAADPVLLQCAERLQVAAHHGPDVGLVAGDGREPR